MAVKWIVTDMDGTLLNSRDRIDERTKECLLACQEKGIRLILASGRSYVRLMPYVQELRMEEHDGCLIELNGLAFNSLKTKRRQVFSQLYRNDIERLFSFLQELGPELQGYEDDTVYYWIPDRQIPYKIAEREKRGYPGDHPLMGSAWSWIISDDFSHNYPNLIPIGSMEELPESVNKMNCLDDPERIERIYRLLEEEFHGKYEFVRTCTRLIEIAPAGITKGKTLRRLMDRERIRAEEVMVFGDGENDVDMFRQAAYSIAMGNAADYVKKYASGVTGTNDENGIAAALEKYGVI